MENNETNVSNKGKFKSLAEALEFKESRIKKHDEKIERFQQKVDEWAKELKKYFDESNVVQIIERSWDSILREKRLFEGLFNEKFIEKYTIEEFEAVDKEFDPSSGFLEIEKLIGILHAADELPLETVQQFYLELDDSPKNRLYSFDVLQDSIHADIFAPLILEDIKCDYAEHDDFPRVKDELEKKAKKAAGKKTNSNAPQNGDEEN